MTTSPFAIIVETQSLNRSTHGQIAGIVYAMVDGIPFPERGWSDSVVVVLSFWLEALNSLVTGVSDSASLRFLDGPFRIDMKRSASGVHLIAVDSRRQDVGVSELDIDLEGIRTQTVRAASQVLCACSEKNWWSPDIDHLVQLANYTTSG